MNALKQSLKALDHHSFETLIFHLLKARYPGVDIKHVNGIAGDEGLDIISGDLDDRPTIWQCKSFPDGVKESQKAQIRESLNRALSHFTPIRWVLCLSVDMDAPAHRWFQKLAKSRAGATQVDLWQGSDIIDQLLYRSSIRENFFPHTMLNTKIREILAKTDELTTPELAALNCEHSDLFLRRLQEQDARFAYAVTFTRDREPAMQGTADELLTVTSGGNTLHVYARDHEALRAKPAGGQFILTATGIEKMNDHILTGSPQTFDSTEVSGFTSDFDFLLPSEGERASPTLSLLPAQSTAAIPLRVTFGKGDDAVTYDYIPFRRVQSGTAQATFESTRNLPFRITLVIRKHGAGTINFEDTSVGKDVLEIQTFVRAITKSFVTGWIEFYDLEKSKSFLKGALNGVEPGWIGSYTKLIDAAVFVAKTYAVTLVMPQIYSAEDDRVLSFLLRLASGFEMDKAQIGLQLSRMNETASGLLATLSGEASYRIVTSGDNLTLFGTTVATGPIEYLIDRARVENSAALLKWLEHEPLGTDAEISLAPTGRIKVRRHEDLCAQPVLQFKALR